LFSNEKTYNETVSENIFGTAVDELTVIENTV
jgi:hypothetical protein